MVDLLNILKDLNFKISTFEAQEASEERFKKEVKKASEEEERIKAKEISLAWKEKEETPEEDHSILKEAYASFKKEVYNLKGVYDSLIVNQKEMEALEEVSLSLAEEAKSIKTLEEARILLECVEAQHARQEGLEILISQRIKDCEVLISLIRENSRIINTLGGFTLARELTTPLKKKEGTVTLKDFFKKS